MFGLPCFKIFLDFIKLHLSCKRKSVRAFKSGPEAGSCKLGWVRNSNALY